MIGVRPRRALGLLAAAVTATGLTGVAAPAEAQTSRAPLQTVIFGDSVPSGAACHCTAFGERVSNAVAHHQGRAVVSHNYAGGAGTTQTMLAKLRWSSVRRATAASELAIVQVGANNLSSDRLVACRHHIDTCYGPTLRRVRADVTEAVDTIYALQRNSHAEIVVVGYWNIFPDARVGRSRGSAWMEGADNLTRSVNLMLRQAAAAGGALYVDGYTPFKGDGTRRPDAALARDGDHPNAYGHYLLSHAVWARLGSRVDTL